MFARLVVESQMLSLKSQVIGFESQVRKKMTRVATHESTTLVFAPDSQFLINTKSAAQR